MYKLSYTKKQPERRPFYYEIGVLSWDSFDSYLRDENGLLISGVCRYHMMSDRPEHRYRWIANTSGRLKRIAAAVAKMNGRKNVCSTEAESGVLY